MNTYQAHANNAVEALDSASTDLQTMFDGEPDSDPGDLIDINRQHNLLVAVAHGQLAQAAAMQTLVEELSNLTHAVLNR